MGRANRSSRTRSENTGSSPPYLHSRQRIAWCRALASTRTRACCSGAGPVARIPRPGCPRDVRDHAGPGVWELRTEREVLREPRWESSL